MEDADAFDKFAPLSADDITAAPAVSAAADDDGWTIVTPAPAAANDLRPDVVLKVEGRWKKPDVIWPYRNGQGRLLGYACRWDLPPKREGQKPDKEFAFAAWCRNRAGECCWKLKHLPAPRPLYGLDKLAAHADALVVVCEGEKAADAAARIFENSVAVTSPGGSQAAGKADWKSVAGRRVLIWPDADEPGGKYAITVATILRGLGCETLIIDAMALARVSPDGGEREPPQGYDAADAVAEWVNISALRNVAHELATPFEPGPEFVSWGDFTMDGNKGLSVKVTTGRGDKTTTEMVSVSSAFEVIGACRDPHGCGWGKWLRWQDADRRTHARYVTDAALQGDPAALCAALADEGLIINRNQQRPFLTYLGGCNVKGRVTIVHRTGWQI